MNASINDIFGGSNAEDILNGTQQKGAVNGASNNSEPRVKSKVWLDICTTVTLPNGETATVRLPSGLALDTMKPSELNTSSGELGAELAARNAFLKHLQDALVGTGKIEPGTPIKLGGLHVEARQIKESVSLDPNQFTGAFNVFGN